MKIFFYFFILTTILTGCSSKLKIANSTQTRWYAGTADGADGEDFNIFINVKEGVKPIFDSIWIDGRGGATETKTLNPTMIEVKTTFIYKGNEKFELKSSPMVESPISYNGRALLRYKLNGEVKYLKVKEFFPTQTVYMP